MKTSRSTDIFISLTDWLLWISVIISLFYIDIRMQDPFRNPKEYLLFPIATLIALLISHASHQWPEGIFRKTIIDSVVITLLMFFCLAYLYTPFHMQSLQKFLNCIVYFTLIPLLRFYFEKSNYRFHVFIFWVIGGFACSVFGIIQYSGHDFLFQPVQNFTEQRWIITGFIGQQTLFAGVIGPLIPLGLVFVFASSSTLRKITMMLFTGCILTAIVLTHTRAVLLGCIIAIPVVAILSYVFRTETKISSLIWPAITLLIIGTIVLVSIPTMQKRVKDGFDLKSSSVNARLHYWDATYLLIKEKPVFGWGLGAFPHVYPDAQIQLRKMQYPDIKHRGSEIVTHPHNELLLILVEGGVVLGFLCCSLMGIVIIIGIKNIKKSPQGNDKLLRIGCLGGLIVLVVDALFSFPFHIAPSAWLSIMLIALLISEPDQTSS